MRIQTPQERFRRLPLDDKIGPGSVSRSQQPQLPSDVGILSTSAFTLIEVMIAMFIFTMVAFAVLELVAVSLGAARSLQLPEADAGMVAAELSLSNSLVEETVSGEFDLFPNYSWERNVYEINTNGLYQVDISVVHKLPRRGLTETKMSVLMFRPPTGPVRPGGRRF